MKSGENAILASNLVKRYGPSTSIGPVSLSVDKGTIFGFLGPNGSGKTTTIRMMLGLIRPDSGSSEILGADPITDPIKALKRVGYSAEYPNFQSFFTAEQMLDFVARLYDIDAAERRTKVKRMLEIVGLVDHAQKKIGKFSKGMVQRLSVAQALINDPELLIMDEPTMGMDPTATIYFRNFFKEISSQGKTIFVSSHLLDEVERLCDHVGMIYRGRMLFQGAVAEILARFEQRLVVQVELRETTSEILDRIKRLDYVEHIEHDANKILITMRSGTDMRAELAEDVVTAGGRILGIFMKKTTLEDAFIETLRTGSRDG